MSHEFQNVENEFCGLFGILSQSSFPEACVGLALCRSAASRRSCARSPQRRQGRPWDLKSGKYGSMLFRVRPIILPVAWDCPCDFSVCFCNELSSSLLWCFL